MWTKFAIVGLEISLDTIEECKSHESSMYCYIPEVVQQFIQILSSVQFLGQFILVHACSSSGVRYLSVLKADTISLKRIMKKTTMSASWKQEEYLALSIFFS
jgi:hypothetical protein